MTCPIESLANRFNRRKSVFAESYDPEGDDDEGEKVSSIFIGLLKFLQSMATSAYW